MDFKNQAAFDAYNKKHKMRKSTKVNVAGKDTTVGAADKGIKGKGDRSKGIGYDEKPSDELKGKSSDKFKGSSGKGELDLTMIDDAMTAPMTGDSPDYPDDAVDDIIGDLKAAGGYDSHIKLLDGAKGDGWKINGILNSVSNEIE